MMSDNNVFSPGSEVWAWLSSGGSVETVERQLEKGWVELML